MTDDTTTRLLAIQRAVACASPSAWRDGLVVAAAGGSVEVATLDGAVHRVTTSARVGAGDPVALHPVAEVLAAGAEWHPYR